MIYDLIVKDGATLTVEQDLVMSEGGSIYVEKGARLIIDGGRITSCGEWEGIKAEGALLSNRSAEIHLLVGGTIENASNGISDDVGTGTGGMIVHSERGSFVNNGRDIEFLRTKKLNESRFSNTEFSGGNMGVTIWATDGIQFTNCTFDGREC